jgi:hypothetical protein
VAAGPANFYRAEATLVDLGRDAVPEITQPADPAPQESVPKSESAPKSRPVR